MIHEHLAKTAVCALADTRPQAPAQSLLCAEPWDSEWVSQSSQSRRQVCVYNTCRRVVTNSGPWYLD